jgi:hypothetical protein
MSNKTKISRFSEVILSLGIPGIGYLRVAPKVISGDLAWQIPVVLLAAWHVILVNDKSFGKKFSVKDIFFKENTLSSEWFLLFPVLVSLFILPEFGFLIFLTMFNWDIYSLAGKRNWLTGLFHNFIGGSLHFIIGLSIAAELSGAEDLLNYGGEILFFGFTMTAGGMHHDSFDAEEDRIAGYVTGAVKFSPDIWWRLAIIPFGAGITMLAFCEDYFRVIFMLVSILYLLFYSFMGLKKSPSTLPVFRKICRVIFIAGAVTYTLIKFSKYTDS